MNQNLSDKNEEEGEKNLESLTQIIIKDINPKLFQILQHFINSDCPNVQKIYDLQRTDKLECSFKIEKQKVNGLSFSKWILNTQKLELTQYFHQLIEGCKFFYNNKIYYREIKQSNIIVGDCLQFAFSQKSAISDPEEDYYEYKFYEKLPMPYNSAPEIFFSELVNPLSDVFSLGIIFYLLVYKVHPFDTSSQSKYKENLKRIESNPFKCDQSALEINPVYCNIIDRMLIYKSKERITWQELFDEFDKLTKKGIQQTNKEQINNKFQSLETRQFPVLRQFKNPEETITLLYQKIKSQQQQNYNDPVISLLYHLVCYKGLVLANEKDVWRWKVKLVNSKKFLQEKYYSNGLIQHFIRKVDECSITQEKIDAFIEFVSYLKHLD